MPKIEMGKKYQTRDGRAVRVFSVDRHHYNSSSFGPVCAFVIDANGNEVMKTFDAEGTSTTDSSNYDLIEVQPEIEGWINVYPYNGMAQRSHEAGYLHPTKEEALRHGGFHRVAVIPVKFKKGDGLS